MGYSNIKCININKIGCEYYLDGMICPDNCKGFISKEEIKNDVEIIEEIEQETIVKKKKY